MDKFLTKSGGLPVWLNDIDFMQESVRKSMSDLLKGLSGMDTPTCIVSGCHTIDTGISAGIVCVDGEILPVSESSVNPNSAMLVVSSTVSGTRKLKNGETVECYEHRYAQWVNLSDHMGVGPRYISLDRVDATIRVVDKDGVKVWKQGDRYTVVGSIDNGTTQTGELDRWYFLTGYEIGSAGSIERETYFSGVIKDVNGVEQLFGRAELQGGTLMIYLDRKLESDDNRSVYFQFVI